MTPEMQGPGLTATGCWGLISHLTAAVEAASSGCFWGLTSLLARSVEQLA